MRRTSTATLSIKQKHYAVVALVIGVFWYASSTAAHVMECLSVGGEIAISIPIDCSVDFSGQ